MHKSLESSMTSNELLSTRLEITEKPAEDSSESRFDHEKPTHQTTTAEYPLVRNKKREEKDDEEEKRATTTTTTVPTTTVKSVGKTTVDDDDGGVGGGSGRERLKRHRVEVAGRVWIPDMWGQETFLKDWIDCTAFDASLMNRNIVSARDSLVEEARRANSSRLRILN